MVSGMLLPVKARWAVPTPTVNRRERWTKSNGSASIRFDGGGVAQSEVGEFRIAPDIGAALPASGAGFVSVAAVEDFDDDRGAFDRFFGEGVVACADEVFQIRAVGLEFLPHGVV